MLEDKSFYYDNIFCKGFPKTSSESFLEGCRPRKPLNPDQEGTCSGFQDSQASPFVLQHKHSTFQDVHSFPYMIQEG